jgi:adenine-specific DNA glycosylase
MRLMRKERPAEATFNTNVPALFLAKVLWKFNASSVVHHEMRLGFSPDRSMDVGAAVCDEVTPRCSGA